MNIAKSFIRPHLPKYWEPYIHRVNFSKSSQVILNCVLFYAGLELNLKEHVPVKQNHPILPLRMPSLPYPETPILAETSPSFPLCISLSEEIEDEVLHLPTTSHYSNHSFIAPNASNVCTSSFCFYFTQYNNCCAGSITCWKLFSPFLSNLQTDLSLTTL